MLKDGYLRYEVICHIDKDDPAGDGGFYSICPTENGIICGGKSSPPYFYDFASQSFIECNLTSKSDNANLRSLEDEVYDFKYMHQTEYGTRFKYILDAGDKYIGVNPYGHDTLGDKSALLLKIYSTENGIDWRIEASLAANGNKKFNLYQNIVVCNGIYYVANYKTILKSSNLSSWEVASTSDHWVNHLVVSGDKIFGLGLESSKLWMTIYDTVSNSIETKDVSNTIKNSVPASSYSKDGLIMFGFSEGLILISNDNFITYKYVQIDTSVGDIRAFAYKDGFYYCAGYLDKKIYYSEDLDNWYELSDNSTYPRTEGMIEWDNDIWFVTRTDPTMEHPGPYLVRMSILNDKLLKTTVKNSNPSSIVDLKDAMRSALSSAFDGKTVETVDQISINTALNTIYNYLKG